MKSEDKMECASVNGWMARLKPKTRVVYGFHFRRWLDWMEENGGEFSGMTPDELIAYQKGTTNSEAYVMLDLLQNHVLGNTGRYNYKLKPLVVIRSFFMHNRAPLPKDGSFAVNGDAPPVEGTLTLEEIKNVVLSSNRIYQAVFLCMLQGGMGIDEIIEWNTTGYEDLRRKLVEANSLPFDKRVIMIKLPGRKKMRNRRPFYTYIGPDAIEALNNLMEKRKRKSEYIFVNNLDNPVAENGLRAYWNRHLRRLGLIEDPRDSYTGNRYGKNPHEIRDVFRSQWEKSPAKASVAEFMMGHVVDPLKYNKAYRDESWTRKEYMKASPYLQIMSSGLPFGQIDQDEANRLKNETVEDLQQQLADQQRMIEEMQKSLEAINRRDQRFIDKQNEIDRLRESSKELHDGREGGSRGGAGEC